MKQTGAGGKLSFEVLAVSSEHAAKAFHGVLISAKIMEAQPINKTGLDVVRSDLA